ncbi:MAG: NAD(FAD)-utilizing dehydrogenase [Anaerovoracaceae bacterium]|jgi:uncharacterized FAD-dependent dehydrogenase|nr:NAD(FAD)-utilizing dehydrogenase [Anaerovoracaceae bacterium]
MYRIHEIKCTLKEDMSMIPEKIIRRMGKDGKDFIISDWKIRKESIDARDKGDILRVYTVDFDGEGPIKPSTLKGIEEIVEKPMPTLTMGTKTLRNPPVVIGFGPCGLFAALTLAEMGYEPLVYERGAKMEQRIKDVNEFWENGVLKEESNVPFGEGGAGTFSDGKLTSGIKDLRIQKILEEFVQAGGGDDLLYKQKPHIGTDVLRQVVVGLREKIIALGGTIHFDSKLTDIFMDSSGICGLEINGLERVDTDVIILAMGHSARDTQKMLLEKGLQMEQKPFSMGLRIEHPQDLINKGQYGLSAMDILGPAEYKLSHKCQSGRGVYTFCMCPGGHVICASSQKEGIVTNGMSHRDRSSGKANSGILVDLRPEDYPSDSPLAGVELQIEVEEKAYKLAGNTYKLPKCTHKELRDKKGIGGQIADCLPSFVVESILEAMPYFGKKIRGFDQDNSVFYGVETRSSSPVRLLRDLAYESNIKGIYPGGEGAGYAGGIMSASIDGIRIGEEIIKTYQRRIV